MSNRLAAETSPYLLQHAENPVDWYPWGEEALQRARSENKPIFLSIGYSACHWCHVMEHESFESERIAAMLNADYVSIKVDREERPDLDQIYMNAVQMMTGRGGWPMSVFLTPDGKPFYGGTYWPPNSRMGMPGFDQVLEGVAQLWRDRHQEALDAADKLSGHLEHVDQLIASRASEPAGELNAELLRSAAATLERLFDQRHGGFGGAPKFPHPMDLQVLLRFWRREPREKLLEMVQFTLDKMAAGGIYDQLGGGFHRYSVDARWLVPHFEKMLYDNGLLAAVYVEAWQATGEPQYERVVRETLDYILREMTHDDGGFYSTQDADSEGEEGKFYVWSQAEVRQVLGDAAAERFMYVYDVSEEGNWEGKNILNLPKTIEQCARVKDWNLEELTAELNESRARLLEHRNQRIWPGLDDKVLVSWNALAIDAFARAAAAFGEPRYAEAASRAADFVLTKMSRDDGRLLHTWRSGQAKLDAYLDDYTYLINALVTVYEATFEERWIDEAVRLADLVLKHFIDPDGGGFYYTADDHEQLITRSKDVQDSSVPSGNAMAATSLLRLGKLTGRSEYLEAAEQTLQAFLPIMQQSATAAGQMLVALDFRLGPTREIVSLGDCQPLRDLQRKFVPNKVVACRSSAESEAEHSPALAGLFAGKEISAGQTNVYICENFACQAPLRGDQIAEAWEKL